MNTIETIDYLYKAASTDFYTDVYDAGDAPAVTVKDPMSHVDQYMLRQRNDRKGVGYGAMAGAALGTGLGLKYHKSIGLGKLKSPLFMGFNGALGGVALGTGVGLIKTKHDIAKINRNANPEERQKQMDAFYNWSDKHSVRDFPNYNTKGLAYQMGDNNYAPAQDLFDDLAQFDGSDPKTSSNVLVYTGPFIINADTTIKAYAKDERGLESEVVEKHYEIRIGG